MASSPIIGQGKLPVGQDPSELFDVCKHPGFPPSSVLEKGFGAETTGAVKARGLVHRDGDWHRAVHVWLVDPAGDVLLQQRSADKDTNPNLWDVSVAGHIGAGDEGLETAVREVEEEMGIGIDADKLQHLFNIVSSFAGETKHGPYQCNEIQEVFLVRLAELHQDMTYVAHAGEVSAWRTEKLSVTESALLSGNSEYVPRSRAYIEAFFAAARRKE